MQVKIICLCLLLSFAITRANAQWSTNGSNVYYNGGYVGIGTSAPQTTPHIAGTSVVEAMIDNTTDGYASFSLKSNGQRWQWSKRPSFEADALSLFYNNGTAWALPYISFQTNGNVGIGTTAPTEKLQVAGNMVSMGTFFLGPKKDDVGYGQRIDFDNYGNADPLWISRYNVGPDASQLRVNISDDGGAADGLDIGYISFDGSGWHSRMVVRADGQVGIGTSNVNDGNYKLYVETGIRTRKIKVDANTWADYVFDKDYNLRPLSEVESFIKKYQHLPDVPSAAEVKKDGIDLGDNQAVLLKK